MGILCHCILSAPLLASTISQHSVCVCLSPSLSERISHPLLLQLLAASLLIPPSRSLLRSVFFILHFHSYSSSHFFPPPLLSFLFSFLFLWSLPVFPQFPCPMISLLHLLLLSRGPTTSSLLPTPLLLTGREGGGRCKLKFTSS